MKKIFIVAVCLAGFLALSASTILAKEVTIKIGPGAYFDESLIGGLGSIDIPVAKEGQVQLSIFGDAFVSKSWFKVAGGGLNLMLKRPAGENGKFYVGAGGGLGHVRLQGFSGTGGMADVVLGGEFSANEKISIFIQGQWIGIWGGSDSFTAGVAPFTVRIPVDLEVRNFSVGAGIAFNVGSD